MCKNEILAKLASNEIDVETASKLLAEQETPQGSLRCKVSEKKAVSLYGVNSRMPVTLYADQRVACGSHILPCGQRQRHWPYRE